MTNKLTNIMTNNDLEYDDAGKKSFHTEAKRVLRTLAKAMNLDKGEFTISSNKGGIAVSGEVTLHTDNVYVQVSKFFGGKEILYRSCNGQKDYTGGQNNMASITALEDINGFAEKIQHLTR